jgi:thioesterase domain-containing protein
MLVMLDTEHPAYSQNLPMAGRTEFYVTYVVDRIRKYARNLMRGRLDLILSDIFSLIYYKTQRFYWKMVRSVFGGLGREIPALIRSDALVLAGAWHAYRPGAYAGRVVLCTAADRTSEYRIDTTLGWKTCATGPIEHYTVPGGHLSMMRHPHVHTLVARLAPYLGAAANEAEGAGELGC